MGRREYIESPKHWKEMYTNPSFRGAWRVVDRVPIENIRIDKSLFSFQNKIDHSEVLEMLIDFDQELWIPVLVNQNFYLLDGQHRLAVAKQLCLKYIDVAIQSDDFRMPNGKR